MKTKKKQRKKSLKVRLKWKYSHVRKKSWSTVWICLKDVYVCSAKSRKLVFQRRRLSSYVNLTFIYERWLVITASWEDPAAVVFVSNKFMSPWQCVICLVIAREIFLLQSDCSAITKVYNFLLLSLLYSFVGHKTNVKNGGHFIQKLDIFRHRPICGLFPSNCQSLWQTFKFQRIMQALLFAKHVTAFAVALSG